MRNVDLSAYSSQKPNRIQPEKVNLGELPPIERPPAEIPPESDDKNAGLVNPLPLTETIETERDNERTSERTEIRPELRSENRSVALPLKRRTKRYSFEFYEDQLVRLKQLKIKAEMEGESLSLSDMARMAFDDYLKDKST